MPKGQPRIDYYALNGNSKTASFHAQSDNSNLRKIRPNPGKSGHFMGAGQREPGGVHPSHGREVRVRDLGAGPRTSRRSPAPPGEEVVSLNCRQSAHVDTVKRQ